MNLDKQYIRQIRAAMSKLPHFTEDDKGAMVAQFTGDRTTHISDMKTHEAINLIRALNNRTDKPAPNWQPKPGDKMRKQIIAMAREMKWEVANSQEVMPYMSRINNWCVQFGKFHKPLNDHKPAELRKLVTQFKKVHKDFLKSVGK